MSAAVISADGRYRYVLLRQWDPGVESVVFVMLNPSIADADIDDPTIRRCISFAKREGFGGLQVVNLFAYCATDPKVMARASDPVGQENDEWIQRICEDRTVIVAWGANATRERVQQVQALLGDAKVHCLGVTGEGYPRHPLYVRGDQPLVGWPIVDPEEAGLT